MRQGTVCLFLMLFVCKHNMESRGLAIHNIHNLIQIIIDRTRFDIYQDTLICQKVLPVNSLNRTDVCHNTTTFMQFS